MKKDKFISSTEAFRRGGGQVKWLFKIFVVNLALQIKVLKGILVIIKFQGSFSHFLGSKSISVIFLGFKTISVIF